MTSATNAAAFVQLADVAVAVAVGGADVGVEAGVGVETLGERLVGAADDGVGVGSA